MAFATSSHLRDILRFLVCWLLQGGGQGPEKETEAQREEIPCPQNRSKSVAEPGLNRLTPAVVFPMLLRAKLGP